MDYLKNEKYRKIDKYSLHHGFGTFRRSLLKVKA